MPLSNPPDLSAIATPNIIPDAFNLYTTPGTDWGSRGRWQNGSSLSRVSPDAANPYGGATLRIGTGTTRGGKRIWLDEVGLKAGDLVQFGAWVMGASGNTSFTIDFLDVSSTRVSLATSTALTVTGVPQRIMTSVLTVPANTVSIYVSLDRTSVVGALDVYSMWGTKGESLSIVPTPSVANTNFWQEITDARDGGVSLATNIASKAPSLVFDPFNRLTIPNADWGGRSRWYNGSNLSLVNPDASNPYGNPTLRVGTAATRGGKRIWLDELGLKPGDTVTFAASIKGTTGSVLSIVDILNSAGTRVSVSVSSAIPVTGATQTISFASIVIPALAVSMLVGIDRSTGGTSAIDIYALWGSRGASAASIPSPLPADVVGEIVDARGTQSSLAGQIAQAGGGALGGVYLQDWRAQTAKILNGTASSQAVIACIGDSITAQAYITKRLRASLQATYGNAGLGYMANNTSTSQGAPEGWAFARVGTWTETNQIAGNHGIDVHDSSSIDAATPAKLTYTVTANTLVIHWYRQTNGGTFRYRVDGGAWTTVDTNGAASYQTTAITGLASSSHVLEIEVLTAGTAGVIVNGVDAQNTINGVRIHRIGNPGAVTSHFTAVNATDWQAGLTALAPNICIIGFGTNELQNNVVPATYTANLQTLITRIRTAMPRCDILLWSPYDTSLTGFTYTVVEYVNALRYLAMTGNYGFLDVHSNWGSYANANSRGLYTDGIHPNDPGGRVISDLMINRLLRVD